MASVLVTGLNLTERNELNRVARKHRISTNEFMRRLIRREIGSDAVTVRQPETLTKWIRKHWSIPGQAPDEPAGRPVVPPGEETA